MSAFTVVSDEGCLKKWLWVGEGLKSQERLSIRRPPDRHQHIMELVGLFGWASIWHESCRLIISSRNEALKWQLAQGDIWAGGSKKLQGCSWHFAKSCGKSSLKKTRSPALVMTPMRPEGLGICTNGDKDSKGTLRHMLWWKGGFDKIMDQFFNKSRTRRGLLRPLGSAFLRSVRQFFRA